MCNAYLYCILYAIYNNLIHTSPLVPFTCHLLVIDHAIAQHAGKVLASLLKAARVPGIKLAVRGETDAGAGWKAVKGQGDGESTNRCVEG